MADDPAPDWIVYYDDSTSFSSQDGPPADAPRLGVQVIAAKDIGCGRLIWRGWDFYVWMESEWVVKNLHGLFDFLALPGAEKIVLQGRGIPHHKHIAILETAIYDPRLPTKTADDPREKEV
jgi:hypothetical protein